MQEKPVREARFVISLSGRVPLCACLALRITRGPLKLMGLNICANLTTTIRYFKIEA